MPEDDESRYRFEKTSGDPRANACDRRSRDLVEMLLAETREPDEIRQLVADYFDKAKLFDKETIFAVLFEALAKMAEVYAYGDYLDNLPSEGDQIFVPSMTDRPLGETNRKTVNSLARVAAKLGLEEEQ